MNITRTALCAPILLGLLAASGAAPTAAQEPDALPPPPNLPNRAPAGLPHETPRFSSDLPPLPTATPDMWYYAQEMRRYNDPKQAVRRKAEWKAQQRRYRLAALKWYGFSNSRPVANPMPYTTGLYSPMWSGTFWDPYRWIGGRASAAVYVTPVDVR